MSAIWAIWTVSAPYRSSWAAAALPAHLTGGIAQTQEMLNFCAQKGVYPECEIIPIQQINQAFERMERGEVKYRFVIDMASLSA